MPDFLKRAVYFTVALVIIAAFFSIVLESRQRDGETEKDYCIRMSKTTTVKDMRASCLKYLQPDTESHELEGAIEADCTNIHPVLYKEAREACDKYNASLLKIIQ